MAGGEWWVVGGGWRVAGGGWRAAGGGWRVAGGGWRVGAGGGRVAGGGWTRLLVLIPCQDLDARLFDTPLTLVEAALDGGHLVLPELQLPLKPRLLFLHRIQRCLPAGAPARRAHSILAPQLGEALQCRRAFLEVLGVPRMSGLTTIDSLLKPLGSGAHRPAHFINFFPCSMHRGRHGQQCLLPRPARPFQALRLDGRHLTFGCSLYLDCNLRGRLMFLLCAANARNTGHVDLRNTR